MTGNEVGDRVHNFFAQDNLSEGQHHSQVVDGSWQVVGNNPWVGSNQHIGLPSSNSKNYNPQQADTERGHSSYSFPVSHGLNLAQSTQSQQPNLNGYMYGRQILQTRQNEANFLGVDTESDCNNITSRGLSTYSSLQRNGPECYTTAIRSESSESPVSFDFFGSEQQMSGKPTGMLQSLPQQQFGYDEMQLMQQQVMMRKMHEFQKQQQIQQIEARQQNSINQIPFITKQASDSHSPAVINGTPISSIMEGSDYSRATEPSAGNTNWLQRGTPTIQGPSNGFKFSLEQGQALNLKGLVPQQVDQSLYGVPISNTRGTSHEYSHMPPDKSTIQQSAMYKNILPDNQYTGFPDQVSMQDGSLVYRQGFQGENMFGPGSGQGLSIGMNFENLQKVNSLQINAPSQEFHGKQELAGPSETLQERRVSQESSSQKVALDPTEEKILFGDDNIWDAFGSNGNVEAGDFNMLNPAGSLNGFPSLQSGTWSALMQSAVAETSSNDIGLQEEWTGLSFQNTEVRLGSRQSLAFESNPKQERILADNNFDVASALSSGSVPLSNDANANDRHRGAPGFHQPGQKLSYDHDERLQMDSTPRSIHQSAEERSKWLSHGPLRQPSSERNQIYGYATHSLDGQTKSTSGHWAPQQSVSFHNSGQTHDETNFRGVGESDPTLKSHENENKVPRHLEEISHGGLIRKADSGSNSVFGFEHFKSSMGSPQVTRGDYNLNNMAAIPHSTNARASQNTDQLLPQSHHLNYHANSSIQRSESSGKPQRDLNKGPLVLSSIDSSDNNAVKMHESENYDRKGDSSDSHHTNLPQHTTTGGLPGGKQKSSGRKAPGPRKFQYHPMGNLDEDLAPSCGVKEATHSQVVSQQIPRASFSHNQGYFGQSNFFGQFPKASTKVEQGHSPDLEGNRKESDEVHPRGTFPAFSSNTSAPLDRSGGLSAPNKATQSSQNMLELLHKVDQPQEHANSDGSVGHLWRNQSSTSQGFNLELAPPSQRLPVQNHALVPQGSNQADCSFSSNHTSPERRDKGHARQPSSSEVQPLPSSHGTSQQESKNNFIAFQGQNGNEASHYSTRGNGSSALTSGLPQSRSRLQNQQMMGSSGKLATNQTHDVSFDRDSSHFQQTDDGTSRTLTSQSMQASLPPNDNTHSHERVSAPQISMGRAPPSSQPFIASGISQQRGFQKMVSNEWTNVSGQHHLFGVQTHKVPQSTLQSSQSNYNVVPTQLTQQDQEDQNAEVGGNYPSGDTDLAEKMNASQGIESVVKNPSEAFPLNSTSTIRDIEAFGRSLKPNNLLHQSYSLLHQMQAMKSTDIDPSNRAMKSSEIDPSNRGLKKLKGGEDGSGSQIAPEVGQSSELNVMVGDPFVHPSAVPSGDSRMLSFSGPVDSRERNASSQLRNTTSQGVLASAQKDSDSYSHTNNPSSVGVEHSQISPQMAPSWFNRFGTFKNGQMLSMFDAQKNATVNTVEHPYIAAKATDTLCEHKPLEQLNAAADSNQIDNIWQRSNSTSVPMEHFSSPQSVALDVADQCLVVVRPKKRKGATSELLPWHKEVVQGSRSLLSISMAEVEWSKSANRLIDKVGDEAETIDDRLHKLRPKKRLILSTQLMQQLFCPPPLAVLSADASSSYETVAYLVARLALRDACSVIPCSGSDSFVPVDSGNLLSDECRTSERSDNQHLLKVMEDFIVRAKNLEKDFIRLEKGASLVDLRIECQDLEKMSVINRFAKFHGRGQVDGAETSSSSDAGAANGQRTFPQRYVTAVPLPRNLPDRVQCHSL
ncbi:hypothetical protein RHSIM_Rhsim12G0151500 [Rhododendron simsii]|uniref:Uncharacterized protein n=1 Tax=Rhododendron simsii TaxID=118357 RepID=A0A834L8L2_RHOSS|nr:hypothetical protein RHSIM_Rhsim12G0151500 [Rhododendron simsii]